MFAWSHSALFGHKLWKKRAERLEWWRNHKCQCSLTFKKMSTFKNSSRLTWHLCQQNHGQKMTPFLPLCVSLSIPVCNTVINQTVCVWYLCIYYCSLLCQVLWRTPRLASQVAFPLSTVGWPSIRLNAAVASWRVPLRFHDSTAGRIRSVKLQRAHIHVSPILHQITFLEANIGSTWRLSAFDKTLRVDSLGTVLSHLFFY